ncbi:glutamyl-tRNA(Gln) amidotransferase subunit PET112 [Sugiyamaella lignohabitans]|uniref:Glutamyl-tRNA(Gln) amidotransferase subunit PET112 n=1 Tax=Sugiyamaella lignohabitans TaxID=796027 RepID=A0A167EKY9_9ASCO|nr:glutamyl-tRNA(Gln) amidotransferase subunit PET112 [Sugiyamaella lignohabitans]ANB14199.1 glutamyl-tRNA(Gln) amidotransferase subunit PET112 [Sugiyamaella lignohabitans]
MRVDVNVSVNGGQRCEIKNLFSTSAVVHAIKAEFERQKRDIQNGKTIEPETRGWDGKNTWKLRGKEDAVDYRYMPDPELMPISVGPEIVEQIKQQLPRLPDDIFQELLKPPFSVPVVDARTMMAGSSTKLVEYYYKVYNAFKANGGTKPSVISNWIVHRLLGELNQNNKQFDESVVPATFLADLMVRVEKKKITKTSGALILKHVVANGLETNQTIDDLIDQFDLGKAEDSAQDVHVALQTVCQKVIAKHPDVIDRIKTNPKSIKFLVGQVMREFQGRVDAASIESMLKSLL